MTALEAGLRSRTNIHLPQMAEIAQDLMDAGTPITDAMLERVAAIGERFEFYRPNFNPVSLPATAAGLDRLYEVFGVAPVEQRRAHDGTSPITVTATAWDDRHQELWGFLVPGRGPAATAQGEAIRITGRLAHEILGNGGINLPSLSVSYRSRATQVPRVARVSRLGRDPPSVGTGQKQGVPQHLPADTRDPL